MTTFRVNYNDPFSGRLEVFERVTSLEVRRKSSEYEIVDHEGYKFRIGIKDLHSIYPNEPL